MALFIPKRVFVKKECHLAPRTKLYIENIKKYNPDVEIIYLNDNFRFPNGLNPKEKFEYGNETVIIGERVEDFVRTFASPGDIVENFETVMNTSWMCAYNCEFCYLQNSRPLDHFLYINLHTLERELESAPYAHTAVLTVWSLISFAAQKEFLKIPPNLMETSDWLRNHFVNARINSDEKAVRSIYGKQGIIYEQLELQKIGIQKDQFIVDRKRLEELYKENKHHPLWINTSEFLDIVGIEHITGNLEYLLKLLPKFKELRLKIRTRSSNLEVLSRYPLFNRVTIKLDLEPQFIIENYAHGTSSLDERLDALEKLQHIDGLNIRIGLEPVIYYDNWETDYVEMFKKLFSKIDPVRVKEISIGFPRYRKQLRGIIQIHYPQTALFDNVQNLQEPESRLDDRLRYTYERRIEMYKVLERELRKYFAGNISLGAENPNLWEKVGLDKTKLMNSSVFQFTGVNMEASKRQIESVNMNENDNEEPEIDPQNLSIQFDSAYAFIQNAEEEIDDRKFLQAEETLNSVVEFDEEGDDMKWTAMYSIRISEALNGINTWKPIKLVGFVTQVEPPAPLEINEEDVSIVHVNLTDLEGDTIDCLRIPYEIIQPHLKHLRKSKQLISLLGAIVSVNKSKGKNKKEIYRFYIKKLSDIITAEDLITYRPSKMGEVKVLNIPNAEAARRFQKEQPTEFKYVKTQIDQPFLLIAKIKHEARNNGIVQNPILLYIKNKIGEEFKIQGLNGVAHQLGLAIEFAILQSLSQDKHRYSFKLHSLLIGPPNVGKGFIPSIAKILNLIFDELPSNSPKLTLAGLVGHVKNNKSIPGVFPQTSGGTVAFQDFHEVRGNKRKEIFSVFSKMMEEGEVLDKTSANTVHEAVVGLHLDTNRYSQVYRDQEFNSFQDIDIPMNILSRFDFIMEIPKNAQRQKEVSLAMVGQKKLKKGRTSVPDWAIEFKMIIAFLRTHYDEVNISEEVADYIREKLIAAIKPYEKNTYFTYNYEDMQNRVSFSVEKFVKAIACANMELDASKEHVDYAFRFIDQKIKFIASIDPSDENKSPIISGDDPATRKDMIAKEFFKKEFTTQEVLIFIKPKMTREIDERTIRRDLTDMGAKIIKKGTWSFIPQSKKKL